MCWEGPTRAKRQQGHLEMGKTGEFLFVCISFPSVEVLGTFFSRGMATGKTQYLFRNRGCNKHCKNYRNV